MTTAQLLDGTSIAEQLRTRSAERIEAHTERVGRPPCLATVLVGDDPASATYVRMKQRACERVGMTSRAERLPADASTDDVVAHLRELSSDRGVDGILLQHPVPAQIDERAAFEAIAPHKDVDGVTMTSFAAMAFGLQGFDSATPGGIIRLLDAYDVPISGRHAVVIGRSPILGKPMGMLLLARDATVTYCHSRTADVAAHVASADIVVAAVGIPRFVQGEWIAPDAVVIDAGYNEGNVGDVDFDRAVQRAGWITPVPGGVGPVTIATLIDQTVDGWVARH